MEVENTNDIYKECLRNHAASLGSYATDGCGEFTPDDTSSGGLHCAACGCHRNFHRKITCSTSSGQDHEMIEHCGGVSGGGGGGVGGGGSGGYSRKQIPESPESERSGKKRFRTKFTEDQKERMLAFAEKLEWKLQGKDREDEIEKFCRGVGVSRKVFKVWMHNHKNSFFTSTSNGNAST